MIGERTYNRGVPEIHPEFDTGIARGNTVPIGQGDGVAKIVLLYGLILPLEHDEMSLVDVEGMGFLGSVLDNPVLYVALSNGDVRSCCRIERGRLSTFFGDLKDGRSSGILRVQRFLGEIKLPSVGGTDAQERWEGLSFHMG